METEHYSKQEQPPPQGAKPLNDEHLSAVGVQLLSSIKGDSETLHSSAERIEAEGFAAIATPLVEQVAETTGRETIIESNARHVEAVVAELGIDESPQNLSERDSLASLADFLLAASHSDTYDEGDKKIVRDMLESIAFIGEKELKEATKGIADYWKHQLTSNPRLQLLIQAIAYQTGAGNDGRSHKSAGLVLQNILDNFSSEEIDTYSGRIIFDSGDIDTTLHTKAVYVDDWSTSGTQMSQMYWNLDYLRAGGKIEEDEACLVAASADQIEQGISLGQETSMPVKAFYKAGMPEHRIQFEEAIVKSDAYPGYITGAHSSNDFTFDRYIGKLVYKARQKAAAGVDVPDILMNMPPLTRVTRRYYAYIDGRAKSHGSSAIEQINRNNGHSYYDDNDVLVFVDDRT